MTKKSGVQVQKLQIVHARDDHSDPRDYLFQDPDYKEEDQERLDAFNNGDWYMLGIFVRAELVVNGTIQTVQSPGLWAIESDSGEDYLNEVAGEEYEVLLGILKELGVKPSQVPPIGAAKQRDE
jgi:hypothetical protein